MDDDEGYQILQATHRIHLSKYSPAAVWWDFWRLEVGERFGHVWDNGTRRQLNAGLCCMFLAQLAYCGLIFFCELAPEVGWRLRIRRDSAIRVLLAGHCRETAGYEVGCVFWEEVEVERREMVREPFTWSVVGRVVMSS